jgi:hypothetical protein
MHIHWICYKLNCITDFTKINVNCMLVDILTLNDMLCALIYLVGI